LPNSLGKENKMRKRIRILLVDDHELVRHGLRRMLEPEEDMDVVGECANAVEAFSQVQRLSPDVILMDTQMPGVNGIEATRCLKRDEVDCDADVIMLAECADYMVEALEAGAAGYLLKDIKRDELADAIRQVYWSDHSLEERRGFAEEAVELVVPPPADAAQTLRFIGQVEKKLHASILQTVGSSDWGTVVTILLKPDPLSNLLDGLRDIPDVEKVEEEPSAREGLSSFLRKLRTMSGVRTNPRKRMLITLK